jgi:hypothetical protein
MMKAYSEEDIGAAVSAEAAVELAAEVEVEVAEVFIAMNKHRMIGTFHLVI